MINSKTKIMGLLGYPLEHSLSPLMHNLTLQKMELNYAYLPLAVKPEDIAPALEAIRVFNLVGVNVTIPHKETVIKYLDGLSPEAEACGAVNLIKNEAGRLIGYNTDGMGFVAGLKEAGVNINGNVVLIGAGGAARAVSYALALEKVANITFLDIDQYKAEQLADFIVQKTEIHSQGLAMSVENFALIATNADIIINCSPVGMFPNVEQSPVENVARLKTRALVCDLIYNPNQTKLLVMAQDRGLRTINGLPMFIHQGALTLEILTGQKPPLNYMEEVILHYRG